MNLILDHMLYVGLTEDHKKSAIMFAITVAAPVLSQSEALNSNIEHEALNITSMFAAKVMSFVLASCVYYND